MKDSSKKQRNVKKRGFLSGNVIFDIIAMKFVDSWRILQIMTRKCSLASKSLCIEVLERNLKGFRATFGPRS